MVCSLIISGINVNKGGLQSVDVNVSPHDELLASQLLLVRVVADSSACEPGVERHTFLETIYCQQPRSIYPGMEWNLKESSQNQWLVLQGSIDIAQFVYQLLDAGRRAGHGVELIVELAIFLDTLTVTAGSTPGLALVSLSLGQGLTVSEFIDKSCEAMGFFTL